MEAFPKEMQNSKPMRRSSALIVSMDNLSELSAILKALEDQRVKLEHVETRKSISRHNGYDVYVETDVKGSQESMASMVESIKKKINNKSVDIRVIEQNGDAVNNVPATFRPLPSFPRSISELAQSTGHVHMYGEDLDADHPGFKDEEYRKRRVQFVSVAKNYKFGQPIPRIEYTALETKTWSVIYKELMKMYPTHACKEYLKNLPLLEKHCGYSETNIPQLDDISNFLKKTTGFTLRPVAGYLTPRDFLAGLAFRVFHCTQYIRHSTLPFYTPEPDCCHEMLGHMPLFLEPSFAEFAQEIGLASLGASDEDIEKLKTCFFFTIEFGLCKEKDGLRVFGAGLLSSVDELKHALSDKALIKPFEPEKMCGTECLITTYQEQYFYSESFEEAKKKLRDFAQKLNRPFEVRYDPFSQTIEILDKPQIIAKALDDVRHQMGILTNAIKKL